MINRAAGYYDPQGETLAVDLKVISNAGSLLKSFLWPTGDRRPSGKILTAWPESRRNPVYPGSGKNPDH